MSDTHSNKTAQVSEKRRKLLKASAITPLIATLPSGVAQANASAFQCINDEPTGAPFISGVNGDGAVRVVATKYEKSGAPSYYYVDGAMYDESGTGSSLSASDLINNGYSSVSGEVYMVYQPASDGLSVSPLGPWPKQQIGGINQPLYQSCLTSLIATNVGNIKGNIV